MVSAGAFLAVVFFAGTFLATVFFADALFATVFLAGTFFAGAFLAKGAVASFAGNRKATTDAPNSRVSAVVSMLGVLCALVASFLILGDVIAAGALGMLYCNGQN